MPGDNEIYKLNYFLKGNDELNLSKLNSLYQAYFEDACNNEIYFISYCSPDKNLVTLPYHLMELYRKFERNLKLIWDGEQKVFDDWETDKKILCFYLKYWLYDQLISNQVTDDHISEFFKLWNDQKEKKCPRCECEFNFTVFSEVKQLKKFYDVFLFWDSYNEKMNNVISNKEYCNYIDVSMKEYNLHQKNCEIENNSSICNEIIKYIIPHLKIRDDFIIKCDTEEASDTNTHNDQDLQHSPEQNPESVTDLLVPDSSNDGKSTRAIISASFAGTVGFLFLLYKFTPLRSMLDPVIRKTKKNLMNSVQGSNELKSQDNDFYPTDMDLNRYNIAYQSR